jgi:hypothetical protein
MMELIRHVLEENTGGLLVLRYVLRQAYHTG